MEMRFPVPAIQLHGQALQLVPIVITVTAQQTKQLMELFIIGML